MSQVVIADDHDLVRDLLRRALEAQGHTVVGEVGDGLHVVDVVTRSKPDILLLDLGLPGLHGLDILAEIGRCARRTRVLVLTGNRRDEFVVTALKNGAAGYLLKSCATNELMAAIAAVAQGRHFVSSEVSDGLVKGLTDCIAVDTDDPYEALSHREREVFHLMAEGLPNAALAERLFISARTVESHRANILRKLRLKTQTDVVRLALRRGLLELEP
jgi:two-component system response regulator NreC